MTEQEFQNSVDYLNSIRENVWIEVEMRHKNKQRFDSLYNQYTGLTVPSSSDTYPYYVWSANANPNSKWGIEIRLYYISDKNIPQELLNISKNNSRHGYERYDKRINNNEFIWRLFQNGFKLG